MLIDRPNRGDQSTVYDWLGARLAPSFLGLASGPAEPSLTTSCTTYSSLGPTLFLDKFTTYQLQSDCSLVVRE